ncbi:MAG TPA: AMP-binding protein, partial [Myxococcales bacterium]|nr:AMP-binding protein [Myxococcales bacterium]
MDAGGSSPLYARIRGAAEARGEAPAIVSGERVVTYGALLELGHRLAARLKASLGSGANRLVAVIGTPCPEMVAAMLAVLENGWTYLPLDRDHPRARNQSILEDAGADAAMVVGPDGQVELSGAGARTLDERTREQLRRCAYVMYTSGSTGAPKGSAAPVAGVLNVLDFMRERFGVGPSSTVLGVTNFSWDLSVPDIYLPLTSGGRLALPPPGQLGDPGAAARAMERWDVDLMQAAPSMWRLLVDSGWPGRPGLLAVAGGEALPEALARQLLSRCRELWNFYGPAECTVWSTCRRVQDPERISLGFALPGTTVHVLRGDGGLAAPGEPGEIAISGVGVADGYLARPELTREKFITLDAPGGKVAAYRTGDLGTLTAEGELFFQGRADLMLKIRGHRVEAREIEG